MLGFEVRPPTGVGGFGGVGSLVIVWEDVGLVGMSISSLFHRRPEWLPDMTYNEHQCRFAHWSRTVNVFETPLVPSGRRVFTCQYRTVPAGIPSSTAGGTW